MLIITLHRLGNLFHEFNVCTDSWGKGEAKMVYDLLKEIEQGESYLKIDGNGLSRVTEIVKILILDPQHPERGYLFQLSEQMPDGRIQERNNHPSETIKSGESPKQAAIRGIEEEIDLRGSSYRLEPQESTVENRASKSYPELPCQYIIHPFKVDIASIPLDWQEPFSVPQKDGSTLFFGWKNIIAGK